MTISNYKAPWSTYLVVSTLIATLICVALEYMIYEKYAYYSPSSLSSLFVLPLLVIIFSAPTAVLKYTIENDNTLIIHRLFRTKTISLKGLISVSHDPNLFRQSVRIMGNGGFFSFTGIFRNSIIGQYRAFVMSPENIVILKIGNKTIAISPENPQKFVSDVSPKIGKA